MKKLVYLVATLGLVACQAVQTQSADPRVVSDIVAACTADGVFKSVGGRLVLQSLPYVGVADALIAAGVDRVCENPTAYAADASTAVWVVKNIRTIISSSRARTP